MDGETGSVVGPAPPFVTVPPVPPPTDAQAAANATADANPNILNSRFMIFLVRCNERSLLNGFNYDRDSLAATDTRGTQPVSFALSTQRMQ